MLPPPNKRGFRPPSTSARRLRLAWRLGCAVGGAPCGRAPRVGCTTAVRCRAPVLENPGFASPAGLRHRRIIRRLGAATSITSPMRSRRLSWVIDDQPIPRRCRSMSVVAPIATFQGIIPNGREGPISDISHRRKTARLFAVWGGAALWSQLSLQQWLSATQSFCDSTETTFQFAKKGPTTASWAE